MDISGENDSSGELNSDISLLSVLDKLGVKEKDWKFEFNSIARGNSGLDHKFDLLLKSRSNDGEKIVCIILGYGVRERSARMSTFYAHSRDVSAGRMFVFTAEPPSMEEKMLSTSLGMEVCQFGKSGEIKEKGRTAVSFAEQAGDLVTTSPDERKKVSVRKSHKRYRDRTQIIHEILNSTSSEDGATITKIIFRCNLNYNSARNIIEDMLKKELIAIRKGDDDKKVYRITKIGSNLLEKLHFYDALNGMHMHMD